MIEKILADRYRLTEQIGMGGMAIVYKAIDLRTGHNVAVKVLRPEFNEDAEFVSRFQREAEAASKMTHHNIVNLLDVGMDGENRYLVMEYVQGKTLKEVIQERGRLPAPLSCQIAIRILSALEHAHRNGIVHRDIKPQNILVHADGHIKVADFGIARIADSATLTRGDMVMGSVHYFSPEQARGEAATAASDLYSTGVVLYEMLTGRVPFDGESPVAVAMQHLHAQPAPIQSISPDVPPSVVAVCMRAMEKNPALRYQSAREMAADLRAALEERPERPIPIDPNREIRQPKPHLREEKIPGQTGPNRRTGEQLKKLRMVWALLTVAAVLGVGIGLYYGITHLISLYSTTVVVPDVMNLEKEAALEKLNKAGIQVLLRETYSNDYEASKVINQVPAPGETVQKEREPVQLLISMGPQKQEMPSLAGVAASDAVTLLKSMGMTNVLTERVVSSEALDRVVSTEPRTGEPLDTGTQITLSISGGECVVPDLYRMTLPEAEGYVLDSQLTFDPQLSYVDTDEEQQHGLVAAQSPESDLHVTMDRRISLSLYRCEKAVHRVSIEVTVPEKDQDVAVRVTAQAEGSTVEWLLASYTVTPDMERTRNVPVELPDGRTYTCMVYQDNVMGQPIVIEGQ